MLKKFKVLKPGIFLQPNQQHGAPTKPAVAVPVGSIIQYPASSAQVKAWMRFAQIEPVADNLEVTFNLQ